MREEDGEDGEDAEDGAERTRHPLRPLRPLRPSPACAKMEPPPGGPPDLAPPQLVAVRPESLREIPGFSGNVEFRFDEVISEGGSPSQGAGTGDLERLIILSPTTRVPRGSLATERGSR